MKRPRLPSAVEVLFIATPDGLRVERLILKPARLADEPELRMFAERVAHGLIVCLKPEPAS